MLRTLCVSLVVEAVVSYRSIPRILNLFNKFTSFYIEQIPHFTSVINWNLRLGVGLLKQVDKVQRSWIAIVDHSINIGIKKVLVVLRVDVNILLKKQKAITLSDCECIGIKVSQKINGETIAKELRDIFDISGKPVGIIADGDYTLNKGIRNYIESQSKHIEIINDIGHVVANALKKQFEKTQGYKKFMKLLKDGATYLRQTDIAFMIPPKIRNKGRFQSISKLGDWGIKVMDTFSTKGRAKKDSLVFRLRKAMPEFTLLKPFIKNFAKTTTVTSEFMKVLKNRGVNEDTVKESMVILSKLPKSSKTKKILNEWLKKHLLIQEKLDIVSLPVSSDIIESLFGKFKLITKRNPQADMNRSVLLIPTLCTKISSDMILNGFSSASHKHLKEWDKKHTQDTIRKKRLEFFTTSKKQGNCCVSE